MRIVVFILMLAFLMAGICFAGDTYSATADGSLWTGAVDVTAIGVWTGTDGDYVDFYNGTSASDTWKFRVGGPTGQYPYYFNVELRFDGGCYGDASWTGTGNGNPRFFIITR